MQRIAQCTCSLIWTLFARTCGPLAETLEIMVDTLDCEAHSLIAEIRWTETYFGSPTGCGKQGGVVGDSSTSGQTSGLMTAASPV